jgi:hypothetical protein
VTDFLGLISATSIRRRIMATEMMTTCSVCEAEIPESVADAADLIYGPSGDRIKNNLLSALERASKRVGRDEEIGRAAVLDALGVVDFASLERAYRHYGWFGECRR